MIQALVLLAVVFVVFVIARVVHLRLDVARLEDELRAVRRMLERHICSQEKP